MKVGDRVWIQLDPKKDRWRPGVLLAKLSNQRAVRLDGTTQELTLPHNRVSCWKNRRVQGLATKIVSIKPGIALEKFVGQHFAEWVGIVTSTLLFSVPADSYATKQQCLAMTASLFSPGVIPGMESAPSYKEMAQIGDALWRTFLRVVLVRRGYRNGKVEQTIQESGWITRKELGLVAEYLNLATLVPPVAAENVVAGELAETWLGWAYTFGGENAYLKLAEQYLSIMEGNS